MKEPGLKARIEALLKSKSAEKLTMGEIIHQLDIDKRLASDVSSALYKLRGQGLVRTLRGPSSSNKGPRYVRVYQWVPQKRVEPQQVQVVSMAMGVFRI